MNGRTVLLLLVVAFFERVCYYVTRTSLSVYLADTETGGLGFSSERAVELLSALSEWNAYAPAAGALIACFVSLRLLLLLGCGVGAIAAASIILTSDAEVPLGLMVAGHSLFLPALYLLVARQFSVSDAGKRFAAFALVLVSANLGALCGTFVAAWFRWNLGWDAAFMGAGLLGLASLGVAAFVRTPPALDAQPSKASMSGAMILACILVLDLMTRGLPDPNTVNGTSPDRFASLYSPLFMLLFLAIAAVVWSARARRGAHPDAAGKVALGAVALILALVFSSMGRESGVFPIAESVCSGFYDAWVSPVAIALAATLIGGRMAGLGLAAWLLLGPLVMQCNVTIGGESYPGPWTGAAGALVVGAAAVMLRVRRRD